MAEARRRLVEAAILVAAVAAAFATGFAGGFQFDDWNVIVEEPRVESLAAWWRSMPGIRPLLKLTYAANRASGLGLAGFHAVNLAVHLGAALLALALLRRLEAHFTAGDTPSSGGAAALLGALLFALHPAQTEAVTYLSGRSSALAALLALGAALAWLVGRAAGRRRLVHGLSPLLMLLSLGVKESAVALPLALLVLARAGPAGGWRAALCDTAVHWAVLAAAVMGAAASPAYRAMAARSVALRGPLENLGVHLRGLWWLLGQAVRPWALLADPALPAPAGFGWEVALAGLGLLLLLLLGLARRGPVSLAALWFLVWLPLSGWVLPRPEPANDRQLYLALLGPAWLLGRRLAAGLGAAGWRRAVNAAAAAVLVGGLGLLTAARNLVYRDEVTFWADVASKSPANARAFNNLGLALSAACRLPEAAEAFETAVALAPDEARPRVNLWLLRQGEPPSERRGRTAACPRD